MKSHTEKSPHQNSKIKLDIQTFSLRKLNDISIKKKLPLFVMFVIILAVVTTVGTTLLFFFNYSRNIAERNSNNALYGLQESLDRYKSGALNYAKIFAVQPNVVSAISEHNTGAVLSSLSHLVKLSDIDFVTVTDANGIVIARTHEPSNYGDSVTNQTNVAKALQGTPFAAIEKGTAVKLSARAGVPVKNGAGQIVGVISAGYRLDRPELVDAIKRTFKTDATIFLKDIRLDTTIKANGKRAVGTKLNPQIVQLVLKQNRKYVGNAMILGRPYLATYMPLLGPDNKPLGILFAGESMDEVIKTNVFIFTSVLIITVILILLIYLVAVKFLTISFIIPLQTAVDVLKKVA
ncbi:MAG TPA: hypothetical protein DDW65_18195, partial [Firmicutes bacterium]|nr:hypothetical protein [Bacillota bacterium]